MDDRPVSLSKFRKTRARDEARKTADSNAVKFGRTKAERLKEKAEAERRNQVWSAHRREPDKS